DFGTLAMSDRDIVELGPYSGRPYNNIGIETKRGCCLKCAYCSYPFLNGDRLRLRSPEKVVDEIEKLVKNFGIGNFMFVDSVFNIPLGHARAICHEIINRGLDVDWNACYDIKNIDEEFMLLAQEAGCRHFSFSPDAITDKGLNCLNKDFTVKDIYRSLGIARKMRGVSFGYGFFCNLPGQDLMGYLKTIVFFLKANLLLMGKGGVNLNWIRVEANTRVHQIAIERGVMDRNVDLLPVDEAGLPSLFYNPPPLKHLDPIVNLMLTIVDKVLKPLSRVIF
ncbi:radical SAM protein, partial [bacterium]|nr:radical SAM protein [bacterium]